MLFEIKWEIVNICVFRVLRSNMKNIYFSMYVLFFIGDDCDIFVDLLFKVFVLYVYI